MAEPIDTFYLSAFNYNVTAAQGTIVGAATTPIISNFVAEMELKLSVAKHMFRFQTDGADVNNQAQNDLKYNFQSPEGEAGYDLATTQNPGNSYMSQGEQLSIATYLPGILGKDEVRNNQVKHDWTRYLAFKLFGSIQATDIMNNEEEVRDSILSESTTALRAQFTAITNYQTAHGIQVPIVLDGPSETRVLSADKLDEAVELVPADGETPAIFGDPNMGPSKQILDQIIANNPLRLNTILNTPYLQPVPLIVGDTIAFAMTVSPASAQLTGLSMTSLGDLATVIPDHTYLIKMVIIAD